MKLDFVTVAAIGALIAMILIGAALFKSLFENPQVVIKEAPLQKNKGFQLRPGEQYRYSYVLNESGVNMTYVILEGYGCTRIKLLEAVNSSGICVDGWGMDESGSNASYMEPSIMLFKPWMLALREGWTWNNSMYISYNGAEEHISDISYRVVRMENYSGRESYVVEIKSGSGPAEYDWVDADKRVLLRVKGEGYEVVLANE
jgi:hypothetical protein